MGEENDSVGDYAKNAWWLSDEKFPFGGTETFVELLKTYSVSVEIRRRGICSKFLHLHRFANLLYIVQYNCTSPYFQG